VRGVIVVVPVHDEEEHLGRCLAGVHRALDHPAVREVEARVVVALDACHDASATIAARHTRDDDVVVTLDRRNVGAARAAGALAGLAATRLDPRQVWLAHTDADTEVPPSWLAAQLAVARSADGVAGIVRVHDWDAHLPATRHHFERSYRTSFLRRHPHVHGANLGVRASAYLDVGGFPQLARSEDHALWAALRAGGHALVATRRVWVTTSARRRPRAAGGFGDALLDIEQSVTTT
jgi:glycosyltransferase involved in cell wall biosynthesis